MKGKGLIWIWALLLLAACTPVSRESACGELGITVEFPSSAIVSKADEGSVSASLYENAVHDLKIWVFRHTSPHTLEAFFETDTDFPEAGGVRRYAMDVSTEFSRNPPLVDVFVLANSSFVGSTLTRSSSWSDVDIAVFDDSFSPANHVSSVSLQKGLPMSGVSKKVKVSGEEPSLTIPTVSVGRAVSKLRYVFCQMYTENNSNEEPEESFEIQKVVLNGGQIPNTEYVFSEEAYHIRTINGYAAQAIETPWPDNTTLASSETPELYSYANQDGPTYENLINEAVKKGELTDLGTTYLWESDKALSGTVYYSITKNNVPTYKEQPFAMEDAGDFARNHSWILYGYFVKNRTLQLGIAALDWDKNEYTIKFDTSSLQVTQPFTVDPAPNVVRIGETDHYNVYLEANKAVKGYIYVTTPQGGRLEIIPTGNASDIEAFSVTPDEALIDPTSHGGRIDITIDRNHNYTGETKGKTITLTFEAFTPDGERKISGASECINQIYHFYL